MRRELLRMGQTRRALAAACITLAVLMVGPASGQALDRAPMGESSIPQPLPGQEVQRIMCPSRSVLIGFKEVLGHWLYAAWPVCQPIDQDLRWSASYDKTAESLEPISGIAHIGAWDVLVPTVVCPSGSFAVGLMGVVVMAKNDDGDDAVFRMPGLVKAVCRRPGESQDLIASPNLRDWARPQEQGIFASFETPEFVGWRGPSDPSSCPANQVAVGAWSIRDQWVRTVGLVCRDPEQVRPKTAVEMGAANVGEAGRNWGRDRVVAGDGDYLPARAAREQSASIPGNLRPGSAEYRQTEDSADDQAQVGEPGTQASDDDAASSGTYERFGIGDPSIGVQARSMCPPNSAISDTWLVVENSLVSFQAWCVRVGADGRAIGAPFHPSGAAVMRQRGFALDDDSIFQNLHKSTCRQDAYVIGYNFGATNLAGEPLPWHAYARCWSGVDGGFTDATYPIDHDQANAGQHLLGWEGPDSNRACRPGDVGVGVWGTVTQDRVESVGLVCRPLGEVRPKLPTEMGADVVPPPAPLRPGIDQVPARRPIPRGANQVVNPPPGNP